MIGAIAIANDLPLDTCNPDDFVGIEGLGVVTVAHPDERPSIRCPHPTGQPQADPPRNSAVVAG